MARNPVWSSAYYCLSSLRREGLRYGVVRCSSVLSSPRCCSVCPFGREVVVSDLPSLVLCWGPLDLSWASARSVPSKKNQLLYEVFRFQFPWLHEPHRLNTDNRSTKPKYTLVGAFRCLCYTGEGDLVNGGDLYANVYENALMQRHIALSPDAMRKITYIAHAGQYSLKDIVLELEFQEMKMQFTML